MSTYYLNHPKVTASRAMNPTFSKLHNLLGVLAKWFILLLLPSTLKYNQKSKQMTY